MCKNNSRMTYMEILNDFPKDQYSVQPHVLHMEQALKGNISNYKFSLKDTTSGGQRSVIALADGDAFVIEAIRVGVKKVNPATGEYDSAPIFAYNDPNYFTGNADNAATQATEARSLGLIWGGFLSFMTQTSNRLQGYSLSKFICVPEKQTLIKTGDQVATELAGVGCAEDSFFQMPVKYLTSGRQANEFTVTLGEGNYSKIAGGEDLTGAAIDTRNHLVLQLQGFLIINGGDMAKQLLGDATATCAV